MEGAFWLFSSFCVLAQLTTVRCQEARIVEEIMTEVKKNGETGRLSCTVSRQQNSKVRWAHSLGTGENMVISSDTGNLVQNVMINGTVKYEVQRRDRGNDRTTYTLVINHLREEDSGMYKCVVSELGIRAQDWPTKSGNLIVQVPPEIIEAETSRGQVERNPGCRVSLRCIARGIPMPGITWFRGDGKPLPDGRLTHRGYVLNITDISKEDAGVYRCVADNNVIPPAYHDTRLVVLFKPEAVAVQTYVGQARNWWLSAHLQCVISGPPNTILRWYKLTKRGKALISANEKYDVTQLPRNGTALHLSEVLYFLHIRNVQEHDYAQYVCEGSNSAGASSATIILYDLLKSPEIVRGVQSQMIYPGSSANLSCTVRRGQGSYTFRWMQFADEESLTLTSNDNILVQNPVEGVFPYNETKYESVAIYNPDFSVTYILTINRFGKPDIGLYQCSLEGFDHTIASNGTLSLIEQRQFGQQTQYSCSVYHSPSNLLMVTLIVSMFRQALF